MGTISKNQSREFAAPLTSVYSKKQTISTYFWAPYLKNGFATEDYVLLALFIYENNYIYYK